MTWFQKIAASYKALGELMAVEAGKRDEAALAKTLGEIAELLKAPEASGFPGIQEMTSQLAQLRRDLDKAAETIRALERRGVSHQDRQVRLPGYSEIMDMRRVGRLFASRESARGFGALACRTVFGRSHMYEDLVAKSTREMAESLVRDLDPGVATAGAELVANIYMADLIANLEAVGVLFPMCDRVPLQTTGATTWPKLTGELTATPVAVAAKPAESAPTFTTVTLTPVKWGLLTPIPNEFFRNPTLLDALGNRIALLMTRAIAYAFDNCLVNGDGTADYGTIDGLLHNTSISAVTAAAAATIGAYTGTEVGDVIAGMAKDYVTDPRFFMSLSSERKLRNIRATTGGPLYERGSNGEPNTIDGYPYTICQRFPAAGAVGGSTRWGAFGDLRLAYYFGMMGGIAIDSSEHVRFENDMTVMRGLAYADADLKDGDAVVTAKTHA